MANPLLLYDHLARYDDDDDDYIDMDIISSSSTNFNGSTSTSTTLSPQHSQHFQFQTTQHNACPADELFYKGKLLPHFTHSPQHIYSYCTFDESRPRSCWLNKFMQINTSSLALKLKTSRDSFMSKFSELLRAKECSKRCTKFSSNNKKKKKNKLLASPERNVGQERPFFGAVKWLFVLKSSVVSSSCSSLSSQLFSEGLSSGCRSGVVERSDGVELEEERSIEGAIDYCKRSQKLISERLRSVAAAQIAAARENEEITDVCRG